MSKELILDILTPGPMDPRNILAVLSEQEGASLQDISTQLFELIDEGKIDYAPGSKFKLVDNA